MKPLYKKILVALAVVVVLAFSFWYGGSAPNLRGWTAETPPTPSHSASPTPVPIAPSPTATVIASSSPVLPTSSPTPPAEAPAPTQVALPTPTPVPTDVPAVSAVPTPETHPLPMDPQAALVSDTAQTCSISVRCDSILANLDALDAEKAEQVPSDGIIVPATEVTFYEGESVFDVLLRVMKENAIHLEFETTPLYNSAYIEGIHNLYEFDCGELSGWMYRVNGWFPNYGCSRYQLQPGDSVEWVYTCDLGVDVGGGEAGGSQT